MKMSASSGIKKIWKSVLAWGICAAMLILQGVIIGHGRDLKVVQNPEPILEDLTNPDEISPAYPQEAPETPTNTVIYVNANASGPIYDGLAWTSAFTDVQSALTVAVYGDEIWVAEGLYY